ncbi:alpha/beta hydrolase domain containing protein [Entamoeba histolytica KU27]|uniref:Alpha/beta hydrolase domain containing protein n=1 Tax=Entamoeba histolytica KU27 TaxID=885311 RepID=M2S7N5_ENTHI|nr:alpha/beta hydrolase domain containing protein [Entamoeba histolytica KU27]
MMILSLIVFLFLVHLPNLKEDQPSLISSPSSLCKILSEKIILRPFQLPVSIGSGIQQMLYVGIRFSVQLKFNRQLVDSSDGGYFALDWLDQPDLPDDAPIILVYHGLAGGSRESYVERFCYYASKKNYRMCVFTCRGCAGTLIKTPRAYSSTNLDDSITSFKIIHNQYPKAPIMTIGYSLGGMILTQVVCRLTNEFIKEVNYLGCIAVSPTWDSLIISDLVPQLFMENFFKSLQRIIVKNVDLLIGAVKNKVINVDLQVLYKQATRKNILGFDKNFNSKIFKYGSYETYYYDIELWYSLLARSKVPFLTFNSQDDPIAISSKGSRSRISNAIHASSNTISIFTQTGGHLGWVGKKKGSAGWDDSVALQYFDAIS